MDKDYILIMLFKSNILRIIIIIFQSNLGNVLGSVVKGSRTVGKQLGFSAAQVARSSAHFANNTAKGFSEEMDRNARSPLLVSYF